MSAYTEFRSSICLDCCRNADKLLHSLQGWDEIQIRSRFHPGVRVGSKVVASPTTHFSLLNVTILSFRRDNYCVMCLQPGSCISRRIIWMAYACPLWNLCCIHTGTMLCLIAGSLWCMGLAAEVMRGIQDSECAFVYSMFCMLC